MPFVTEHINHTWIQVLAGTEVLVIADHINVMIVEDEFGRRFPVRLGLLSDKPVSNIPPVIMPKDAKSKKKKGSLITVNNTQLF